MTALRLVKTRLQNGVWEGVLMQDPKPETAPIIEVRHLEQTLEGVEVLDDSEGWALRVPVPVDVIRDGVMTFVILDQPSQIELGHFTIIAGEALAHDIRAEVDLLRAELDMLKRAFRRHCVETG